MSKYKGKHNLFLLIPLFLILFAALTAGAIFLSIDLRYRYSERKIEREHSETDPGNYYYSHLTAKEQLLYRAVNKSAEKCEDETEILLYRFTEEEFNKATKALNLDKPMLFYVDFGKISLYNDKYKSSVRISYISGKEEIERMKMEIEAVSAAAMAYTQSAENDFEREVILHDFISRNCEYITEEHNGDSPSQHTAYGALVEKAAYCDGYSSAYKILLDRCGIECIITEGTANGANHEWNVVKIDGEYYNVDVTWDDADLDFAPLLIFHGYFNLNDQRLSQTHGFSDFFPKPVCKAEGDYYSMKGVVVEDLDHLFTLAYSELKSAVESKQTYFEICPVFEYESDDLKAPVFEAIKLVNSDAGTTLLSESFRVFPASEGGKGLTIQIYYVDPEELN